MSSPTQRWAMESGCVLAEPFDSYAAVIISDNVPLCVHSSHLCVSRMQCAVCIPVCVCSAVFDFHHSTG